MLTPSEEVIGILAKYLQIVKAQSLLEKYCERVGTCPRELTFGFFPQIILQVAESREDFKSLNDIKFNRLLQELVLLSNSKNPRISKNAIRSWVRQKNRMKTQMEEI